MTDNADEKLARKFHDTYERLAPSFGYKTREDTKEFDPTTPNGQLMTAVCREMVPSLYHHGRETSARVSTLAAHVMKMEPADTMVMSPRFNSLLENAKTLAGSCMSQDETPGQAPKSGNTFLDRLEIERAELHERASKLAAFIANGCPGVDDDENSLLLRQHSYMANYFSIINQRAVKHGLDPMTIPELTIGENG